MSHSCQLFVLTHRHLAQGINPHDKRLWATFTHAFQQSFTDTTKVQNVHQKLMHVKMKGDALDNYIAKFQHLRALAGWGEDNAGTLMLFKQGLTLGLHKAILEKTPVRPTTLNGWAEAA